MRVIQTRDLCQEREFRCACGQLGEEGAVPLGAEGLEDAIICLHGVKVRVRKVQGKGVLGRI